jgi:hypothetical protein
LNNSYKQYCSTSTNETQKFNNKNEEPTAPLIIDFRGGNADFTRSVFLVIKKQVQFVDDE